MVLTAGTMVVEIIAGVAFGSMALLADGLHMASHASALLLAWFAYRYARRHAGDARFCFGTGKVNALAGFSGALLLAVFAIGMSAESIDRFIHPVRIHFNMAILVAVIGLLVNAVSVFILGDHHHDHNHNHGGPEPDHAHESHHHDYNLRAAYLHVLVDAMTSVFAIVALVMGKYFQQNWLDPMMGIVGGFLVARWSWGLLKQTSRILLDFQGPDEIQKNIRAALESDTVHVADLHLWSIAPNQYAAIVTIVTSAPQPAEYYKDQLPANLPLSHVTVEAFAKESS